MTNSKKIIIVATLIHLAAIVYGIIRGLWDAVILANHKNFPSVILRPEEEYNSQTIFKLSVK